MALSRFVPITLPSASFTGSHSAVWYPITRAVLPDEMFDPIGSNRARSDGGDVRVYTDSGLTTEIPFVPLLWAHDSVLSAADAKVLGLVRLPSVSDVTDTTIYVGYADPALTKHAKTDPNGQYAVVSGERWVIIDGAEDLTGHYTVTQTGTIGTTSTPGALGLGWTINGSSAEISLDDAADALPGAFTIRHRLDRTGAGATTFETIAAARSGASWKFQHRYRSNTNNQSMLIAGAAEDGVTAIPSGTLFSTLATVFDGSNIQHYFDGAIDGTLQAISGSVSNPSIDTTFGSYDSNSNYGVWDFDISAFANAAHSAARIADEYGVWNNPSVYFVPGTPQDAPSGGSEIFKSVVDTITTSDTTARIVTLLRSVSDAIGLTDTVGRIVTLSRSVSDVVGLTDTVGRIVTLLRSTLDTVTTLDAVSRIVPIIRSVLDAVGLTDNVTRVSSIIRSVTDTIGLTDTTDRIITLLRSTLDTINMSDTVGRVVVLTRVITDTITLTVSVTTDAVVQVFRRTVTASTKWVRSVSTDTQWSRTITASTNWVKRWLLDL